MVTLWHLSGDLPPLEAMPPEAIERQPVQRSFEW